MAPKQKPDPAVLAPEHIANLEPVVVRHIIAEIKNQGIEPNLVLDGTGLRDGDLQNDDFRMSYSQTSQVIRRALRLLEDQRLGLRLGARVNLVSWGSAYVGLLACANSDVMLDFLASYLPSAVGLLQLRYEHLPRGPSIVAYARFDEPTVASFLIDKAFAAIAHTCQSVLGSSFGPIAVSLTTARPAVSHPYAQVFGCPVHFAQAENRMQFPAKTISIASADDVVLRRVRKMLDQQQQFIVRSHELEASVVQTLQGRFDSPPTLSEIAANMHISERTLRRRLADLGVGYAELLDRERKRRALSLIRSGQHTLNQVALEIGFADVRNLRRAVKRWTGQSPTALRRQA